MGLDAHGAGRRQVRNHHQVALGIERLSVLLKAHVIAGDRLMEDRDRQMDRFEFYEFFDGHGLAARYTRDIGDRAIDFFDPVSADPSPHVFRRCSDAQNLALARPGPLLGTHAHT